MSVIRRQNKELMRMSCSRAFRQRHNRSSTGAALGYSWREIGGKLEMDHSAVRRAYFGELGLVLRSISPPGESPKC